MPDLLGLQGYAGYGRQMFNRPRVAGAVLQTALSLID